MPRIRLTPEIFEIASARQARITRTRASDHDGLVGAIGEAVFSWWFFGSLAHRSAPGEIDFGPIEVKCSQIPLHPRLHLLVREDYARKRAAPFYVQCVLDIYRKSAPAPGDEVFIVGWTTHHELMQHADLRDWGSKSGGPAGYKCYSFPFSRLQPMRLLREAAITQGDHLNATTR